MIPLALPATPVATAPARRSHVKPSHSSPKVRRAMLDAVRASCERRPGVYRMLSETGTVLYVGQSRVLRTRLLSYFRAKGRGNKAARILRYAFSVEWEYTNTEFSALLRELRLIKLHRPRFNSMMVTDDWPRGYVALTGGPVPGLRVVPRSDDPTAVALFGPFRRVSRLRDAVKALADTTGLRDCMLEDKRPIAVGRSRALPLWFNSDTAADGTSAAMKSLSSTRRTRAPGCFRHDLQLCAGPCIGAGDGANYRAHAVTIRAFLEGETDAPVAMLTQEMLEASAALQFERAAILRDRLAHVQWLHERVQHFHSNMDRLTFRYAATGPDGQEWTYLIRRGTVRAEVETPRSKRGHTQLNALARKIFAGPDPDGADIPTHDLDEFYLVSSWFRRRPAERASTSPSLT